MKDLLKALCRKLGSACVGWMYEDMRTELARMGTQLQNAIPGESQLVLYHMYREMATCGKTLPRFSDVGFRCHSQFEEDGILLYIFALIGTTNKTCVEVCAGNGIECNTANLILNHGWWGYLFDGADANVAQGVQFYRDSRETRLHPPKFTRAWITAENINDVIAASGVSGDIDLLSLDIDGMDYWVWRAMDCIRPRVVVCETHNVIGPDDALTVPYDPGFRITTPDYHSASLAAMAKLADQKGYRLVGTHRYGFNAFFVLKGVGDKLLPTVNPAECVVDPYSQYRRSSGWPKVKDMNWIRV